MCNFFRLKTSLQDPLLLTWLIFISGNLVSRITFYSITVLTFWVILWVHSIAPEATTATFQGYQIHFPEPLSPPLSSWPPPLLLPHLTNILHHLPLLILQFPPDNRPYFLPHSYSLYDNKNNTFNVSGCLIIMSEFCFGIWDKFIPINPHHPFTNHLGLAKKWLFEKQIIFPT